MATVSGFTAERTQEIEDATVVAGLVDVNGRLLLTRRDGGAIDAGSVVGPKGNDAVYHVGAFPGGVAYYSRLAVIDGVATQAGGSIEFFLSGLGNYGTARRATVLVHAAQRGSNVVSLKAWGWGFDEAQLPLTIYTRQMGEFLFEVWGLFAPFSHRAGMLVMANHGATVAIDGATIVAPSNLVEKPIALADSYTDLKDKPTVFQPSAHFHSANDITVGTLPDPRLPARLREIPEQVSGQNLNDVEWTGFYMGSSMGNSPTGGTDWMYIEVVAHNTIYRMQRVTIFAGNATYIGRIYIRHEYSGTWGAWSEQPSGIATWAETAGTSVSNQAITPATLAARVSQPGVLGLIPIATGTEVAAGTDHTKAVTPAGLSARSATYDRTGLVEHANAAEVLARSDVNRVISPGLINSHPGLPWAMATGAASMGILAVGASADITVTFPVGRFSIAPMVQLTSYSTRFNLQVTAGSVTTTGFTIRYSNYSDAAAAASTLVWMAVQIAVNGAFG